MGLFDFLKKPKTIKAPEMDIGKDIQQYISGMSGALPQILSQEQQFRPEFQGLNLGDIQSFLSGAGGQQGLFGLSRKATRKAGRQIGAAREAELAQMAGQTGMARGLLQSMSPEAAAQVERANQEAERAYAAAAQGLTPEQRRMSDQQSREAFGSRGMLGSTGSVASEILNREGFRSGLRSEAAQRGSDVFNLGQSFYTQPGLAMLGSTPLSYQAGQQQLGLGLGAIGAGTPQLFNPAVGLNLGAAQRQNQLSAASANAQAQAAHSSGIMDMIGKIGGAALPLMFSDRRLKTDISKVGKTNEGLPIYTYKYKGDNTTQMGVMAQDVEKKTPSAVKEIGGFKAVNYKLVK